MVYVQGAGASFPNTLYQNAIRVYRFVEPNVELSYTSMGSGNGKCRIADWEVSAHFEGLHVEGGGAFPFFVWSLNKLEVYRARWSFNLIYCNCCSTP